MTLQDEPIHHRRYRVAWQAYRDPDTPKNCLLELEKEMDNAQNYFEWEEFQTFKKTLVGFNEHWNGLKKLGDKAIKKKYPDAD